MKNLVIRAPFHTRSGYNTLSETICLELSKIINVYPISTDGQITNNIIKSLIKPTSKEVFTELELCILPIQIDLNDYNHIHRIPKIGKRVFFTMWESTQLSMNVIELLNTGIGVIVPNEWNIKNFKTDGIIPPVKKCPLFVDTTTFNYKPHIKNDVFVFGTGNMDLRKKTNEVIKCFCKAFSPDIKDVMMKIKIDAEDISKLNRVSDDRLEINTRKLDRQNLANWYHNIDIFVSGATAEGWGLMQHEAMACGRPIIATKYAGLAEFFDEKVGFPVKYEEVPSKWSWGYSNGFWSEFNEDDMIDIMRLVYNNPDKVELFGKLSAKRSAKFTVNAFVNTLIKTLQFFEKY